MSLDTLDENLIKKEKTYKRPIIISFICITGVVINFLFLVSAFILHIFSTSNLLFLITGLLSIIGIFGMWNLRRNGGFLFMLTTLVHTGLILYEEFIPIILLIGVTIITVVATQLKEMK